MKKAISFIILSTLLVLSTLIALDNSRVFASSSYTIIDPYTIQLDGPATITTSWSAAQQIVYSYSGPCTVTRVGKRSWYQTGITCTGAATVYLSHSNNACGYVDTVRLDGQVIESIPTYPCPIYTPQPTAVASGNTVTFTNPTASTATVYYGYISYTTTSLTFTANGPLTFTVSKVFGGTANNRTYYWLYELAAVVPAGGVVTAVTG